MFEKDDDYYKARKESKDRITKVIKVWNGKEEAIHDGGFQKGAEFGYNKAKGEVITETTKNYNAIIADYEKHYKERIAELEKENAELKEELEQWKDGIALKDEEIGCIETDFNTFKSKAKELLNEFMRISKASDEDFEHDYSELIREAEQFLNSEVEK